jgi:hypothetical protein
MIKDNIDIADNNDIKEKKNKLIKELTHLLKNINIFNITALTFDIAPVILINVFTQYVNKNTGNIDLNDLNIKDLEKLIVEVRFQYDYCCLIANEILHLPLMYNEDDDNLYIIHARDC